VSDTLLLTGGTGFLGMELIARMLEQDEGPDIVVAIRAREEEGVDARLATLVAQLYETVPPSAGRLSAVRADLTAPGLGMAAKDRRALGERVDRVIHCAASISFDLPLEEAREINVAGTRRVLDLARELPALERFVHVSTAYVAGRAPGVFSENHAGGSGFRNTYERTKMEAEDAVAGADDIPSVVVRPSIVVGESDSGWTSAFNVLYWPLQAFARGLLDTVPADPAGVVDMVPVDYVAEVIERAAFTPGVTGRFHAVCGESSPSVAELIEMVCDELDRPQPTLSAPGSLPADHPAAVFAPYFDVETRFDDRRAARLVGDRGPAPEPSTYLPLLLEYGATARWGKRPLTREAARTIAGVAYR
jgi:nucleoside-diphosphate-sugar epimerase